MPAWLVKTMASDAWVTSRRRAHPVSVRRAPRPPRPPARWLRRPAARARPTPPIGGAARSAPTSIDARPFPERYGARAPSGNRAGTTVWTQVPTLDVCGGRSYRRAMRIESSVTSVSWIPSEAITGLAKMPFEAGITHYDDPPPDVIDDV